MPTVNKKSDDLKRYHNLLVVLYKFNRKGMKYGAAAIRGVLDKLYDVMSPNDKQRVEDWYCKYWLTEEDLQDAGI